MQQQNKATVKLKFNTFTPSRYSKYYKRYFDTNVSAIKKIALLISV